MKYMLQISSLSLSLNIFVTNLTPDVVSQFYFPRVVVFNFWQAPRARLSEARGVSQRGLFVVPSSTLIILLKKLLKTTSVQERNDQRFVLQYTIRIGHLIYCKSWDSPLLSQYLSFLLLIPMYVDLKFVVHKISSVPYFGLAVHINSNIFTALPKDSE